MITPNLEHCWTEQAKLTDLDPAQKGDLVADLRKCRRRDNYHGTFCLPPADTARQAES